MTEDFRKMIKECLADDSDRFSAWEIEFLDSVNLWEGDFRPNQEATIAKIWSKLFGGVN